MTAMDVDIVGLVAVAGFMVCMMIALIGAMVIGGIKALRGGGKGKTRAGEIEEARMIQSVFQGLAKMEERVEALETLLLEREGKGGVK